MIIIMQGGITCSHGIIILFVFVIIVFVIIIIIVSTLLVRGVGVRIMLS